MLSEMASFSKWLQEIYSMSFLSSNSFFFPEEKYYTQSSKPRHQIEGEQKALIGPWDIAPFVCIVLFSILLSRLLFLKSLVGTLKEYFLYRPRRLSICLRFAKKQYWRRRFFWYTRLSFFPFPEDYNNQLYFRIFSLAVLYCRKHLKQTFVFQFHERNCFLDKLVLCGEKI